MPSTSKKQHNFMAAVAHSPAFAKKVGIPQSVGQDFNSADKGRKFSKGGGMATKGVNPFAKFEKSGKDVEFKGRGKEGSKREEAFDFSQLKKKKMAEGGSTDMAQDKAMIRKAFKQHDMQEHKGGKGTDLKLARGGRTMRYDEGGEVDPMEEANKGKSLDTEAGPKATNRPYTPTPKADAPVKRAAARADTSYSNEGRYKEAPEDRDSFGIPGKVGKPSAPNGNSVDSTELSRNLEAIGNATGASAAIQGVRRGAAIGKGLAEFAAGKKAADEAGVAAKGFTTYYPKNIGSMTPSTATKVAEKVAEKAAPAVRVKRAAPDASTMEKVNKGLRDAPKPVSKPTAAQKDWAAGPKGPLGRTRTKEMDEFSKGLRDAPKPVSKPTAAQKEWAKGPRMGKLGRGAADTLDEFGGAMKRGGKVNGYASGGSVGSFRSSANGIAQRGKTRGKMC